MKKFFMICAIAFALMACGKQVASEGTASDTTVVDTVLVDTVAAVDSVVAM